MLSAEKTCESSVSHWHSMRTMACQGFKFGMAALVAVTRQVAHQCIDVGAMALTTVQRVGKNFPDHCIMLRSTLAFDRRLAMTGRSELLR